MTLKPVEAANLGKVSGIRHGFFTRTGGVSSGLYAGLNCGLGSNDDQALVLENRRMIGRHLGAVDDKFGGGVITLYQEHGTTALEVTAPPSRDALPHADAVISKTPGLVIGVLTADVPRCFSRTVRRASSPPPMQVGAEPSTGSSTARYREMERLGARRERISAAVGPCIGQSAYEVGPEFEAAFLARDPANGAFFQRNPKTARPHFDLPGFVVSRLANAGVSNIENLSALHLREQIAFLQLPA